MAEEQRHEYESAGQVTAETKDRGLLDFVGKKGEEKAEEEVISQALEKVQVSEAEQHKDEKKKQSLLEKLRQADSSSSSSSEEEVEEGGEKVMKKKKKKKGVKEETGEEDKASEKQQVEEKRGLLEKIKEKLPGQHKAEKVPPAPAAAPGAPHEGEPKEKKGILEKIKEKLPGYHPKTQEEKENEKEGAADH